jgi:hypothetical protein
MSYYQGMQKGNLDSVKADEHGKIKKETVDLVGVSVTRVTFDVGAKWSTDFEGLRRNRQLSIATCGSSAIRDSSRRHGRWVATGLFKE